MNRVRFASFVALTMVMPFLPSSPATAMVSAVSPASISTTVAAGRDISDTDTVSHVGVGDVRELDRSTFTLDGRQLPRARYRPSAHDRVAAKGTPPVGTVREWLGLDDSAGTYYRKKYVLRGVGRHVEVWVAQDLAFPASDCRKNATEITDAQVTGLITKFDQTIYPRETAAFSTPPDRDGTKATIEGDFTGDGERTVTLVDNIRDDNYFHFPESVTYIAGFFSRQLNELFDRNVMTIDAYDWVHRMGADPANEPTTDLCTSRPARPLLYEGTFAHEWQHLLEYYADPDEATWVNEGLSDFAQTLTGYVDARATVYRKGMDSHLICFQGFGTTKTRYNANPRECGGPENSLNLWDEGAPSAVLADYGNAYQFLLYLRDRFGLAAITKLHRDGARQGLLGVAAALPADTKVSDVLHDFQIMTLVDQIVDRPGGTVVGVPKQRVIAPSLRSTVNLANPSAYSTPGAAPNGADYVALPTPLRSIKFVGAKHLPPQPVTWTIADKTLFSGNTSNLDTTIVHPIRVPAQHPTLTLEAAWDLEESYDFAYVTISVDGGKTYTTIAGDRTVTGPLGPGLTGASGGVRPLSYNLSAYAGKNVLLGLRYVTDASINAGGWRIGKIDIGGQSIGTTALDGWHTPTELVPTPVHAWHVTLVGIDGNHVAVVPLADRAEVADYPRVVAVVAYDEPTEKLDQYAPYQLTANGIRQPGGAPLP